MKVLVVEDERPVAEMLEKILVGLGNACVCAETTDAAERALAEAGVDAVTLDLGIPGRGGLTWLESVAVRRPDIARRTLVITGQDLDAHAVERLARCGAGVLAKPFTIDHLRDALRSQVERALATPRD